MDDITSLQIKCNEIQSQVNSLSSKIDFINPALFLEFRGTVVETLKTFDRDIDEIKKSIEFAKEQMFLATEKKDVKRTKELDALISSIAILRTRIDTDHDEITATKTKIIVYSSLVSAGLVILFTVFVQNVFK